MSVNGFDAVVREATSVDIEQIIQLGMQASASPRWNRAHYLEGLTSGIAARVFMVAEGRRNGAGLVGFIVAQVVGTEWEIENVVVAAAWRGNGFGHLLLASMVERASRCSATRIMLEVRAGNQAAIGLYKKCGFQQDGIRPAYYSNPTEDALLFSLSLLNSS